MRFLIAITFIFSATLAFSQQQKPVEKTITYSLDTTSTTDFRIIETTFYGNPDDKNTSSDRRPIQFTDKAQVAVLLENIKKESDASLAKANEYAQLANEWNTKAAAIRKLVETNPFFNKK